MRVLERGDIRQPGTRRRQESPRRRLIPNGLNVTETYLIYRNPFDSGVVS